MSPLRDALSDQAKRLADLPHIPCETTNLAVAGTVPDAPAVPLQFAPGRRGDAGVSSSSRALA